MKRYKTKYDVVIIGSGLGGLQSAYMLAEAGYSVCVLEKNKQTGGNLQTFVRDRCIFDTGVHYIGGLDEGQNLYQYFKYFGLMDKLKLKKMDTVFDKITFNEYETEFSHAQTYPAFIEHLSEQFPKERANISKYCDTIQRACKSFPLYQLEDRARNMMDDDANYFLTTGAKNYIDSITDNQLLRDVLAGSNPLYAGIPNKTPLYSHALTINTYIESAYKCVDGGSQICRILTKGIRSFGGEILKYKDARKFIFENGTLTKVETAEGEQFEGKYFISNIHPHLTLDMIGDHKIRKSYVRRIRSLKNTISCFNLHLVFKENTFPYFNYNYYHYNKQEHVWAYDNYSSEEYPHCYMLCTPASSKSDEFAESLTMMTYMTYDEVAKWENTFNTVADESERGNGYEDFKQMKAEKCIIALEKKYPNIRSCIKSVHTSTPLSFRDYIGTHDGAMYGIVKDYNEPLRSFISPKTKVPNLFLTGQSLNMHGILGVTISSVLTCSEFLGRSTIMQNIKRAQ